MYIRISHLLLLFALLAPILLLPQSKLLAKWLPAAPIASTAFTYQGSLTENGQPANGDYSLNFLLFDAESGGAQMGATLKLPKVTVIDGHFSAQLDFGDAVWTGEPRWLETHVDGTALTPRQPIGTVPYAIYAQNAPWTGLDDRPAGLDDGDDDTTYRAGAGLALNGNEFSASGVPYANVVTVAKSGGDFTSVAAAVATINDATHNNPYLVWVAPGVYTETITMKSHVDIAGAGEDVTVLVNRHVDSNNAPPIVTGADAAALRDLTVKLITDFPRQGTGSSRAIASDTASPTVSQVTVRVDGLRGSSATGIVTQNGGGQFSDLRIIMNCGANINTCSGLTNVSSFSNVERSTINVSGAFNTNIGIVNSSDALPASLVVSGSDIAVHGRNDPNHMGAQAIGISVNGGSSLTMRHSAIVSSGGTHSTYGIGTTDVSGVGQKQITINHSEVTTIDAVGGLNARAMRFSHLENYVVRVGSTLLVAPVHQGTADIRCINSYNGDYNTLGSRCEDLE